MQIGLRKLALLVGGVTPGNFDICPPRRGSALDKKNNSQGTAK